MALICTFNFETLQQYLPR